MTITEELINEIRSLLVDDGDEEDHLFTDKAIAKVAGKADSINHALYILYTQKAGKLITEEGRIKSIKAGNEEAQKLSCIEMSRATLEIAENYKKLWKEEIKDSTTFIY